MVTEEGKKFSYYYFHRFILRMSVILFATVFQTLTYQHISITIMDAIPQWWSNFTIALITLVLFVYLLLKWRYRYWERKGVAYLNPHLLFGNIEESVVKGLSEIEIMHNLYRKLAPHKFAGYFRFQRPTLLLRDPEMIKHIMSKDFSHFQARNIYVHRDNDPLSYHLFNIYGDHWKSLRIKLTPTFTSGKMKMMFHLMKECADLLADVLGRSMKDGNNTVEVEMKDVLARYSTDVISSCAFGLQANSLENPETEFRQLGKKVFEVNFRRKLMVVMNMFYPKLVTILNLTFLEKYLNDFFLNLVADTVKFRDRNNVQRNDFLNILIKLRKEDKKSAGEKLDDGNVTDATTDRDNKQVEMTLELMAAQCFIFFVAGFETSSGVLSACLLELAKHLDIQEKVRKEIDDALQTSGGELTYEILNSMPYLDKVVSEALRMYPSLSFLFRQCTKQYQMPGTNVLIEEGTEVFIPVYGLHRDPQYYPNPDEFNPENFSEENKASRHSFAYLPFGEGPRICIGLRFGMMQVKLGLATLLQHYRFALSPKMTFPVKFVPKSLVTMIEGGIWLNCSKR